MFFPGSDWVNHSGKKSQICHWENTNRASCQSLNKEYQLEHMERGNILCYLFIFCYLALWKTQKRKLQEYFMLFIYFLLSCIVKDSKKKIARKTQKAYSLCPRCLSSPWAYFNPNTSLSNCCKHHSGHDCVSRLTEHIPCNRPAIPSSLLCNYMALFPFYNHYWLTVYRQEILVPLS